MDKQTHSEGAWLPGMRHDLACRCERCRLAKVNGWAHYEVRDYTGVILRDSSGRFLLVNHSKKTEFPWRIPGGKVERGEQPIAGAAREALEEIGIRPQSLMLVDRFTKFVDGGYWQGFYFLCKDYEGFPSIMEPEKQSEMRYFHSWEIPFNGATPETVEMLTRLAFKL